MASAALVLTEFHGIFRPRRHNYSIIRYWWFGSVRWSTNSCDSIQYCCCILFHLILSYNVYPVSVLPFIATLSPTSHLGRGAIFLSTINSGIWRMISWHLAAPNHQHVSQWACKIVRCLSLAWEKSNYLQYFSSSELYNTLKPRQMANILPTAFSNAFYLWRKIISSYLLFT